MEQFFINYKWYINKIYIDSEQHNLKGWKVIIAATNGAAGNLGNENPRIIGEPKIIEKNSGFTQTFISIGDFETKGEIESLNQYIKTKFARFMIGTLKATQRLNKEVFSNLPLQNFTENSDIDWSKPIDNIDEQLFDKYNLSEEERVHIKKSIKDM